jgi:hypothetical protein
VEKIPRRCGPFDGHETPRSRNLGTSLRNVPSDVRGQIVAKNLKKIYGSSAGG